LHVQSFQGYGSDFIKQSGFSPDAYVQMAMQLATYRLWGEQGGTYEATQVRPFLHGRTETTRTVSTQSAAFVHEMGMRPKMDETKAPIREEKLRLLQEAVNAHVKYIGLAAKAQGVDRHFMGLSMLVQDGESAPDLYSDPVFARSKRWRVSTSHLTHPKFDNWGYGPGKSVVATLPFCWPPRFIDSVHSIRISLTSLISPLQFALEQLSPMVLVWLTRSTRGTASSTLLLFVNTTGQTN
jgi:hypothetical protein